ncbi:MAG: hypothetical protein ACFE9V_18785 [Candidatus Hodarchaeota archaeon]
MTCPYCNMKHNFKKKPKHYYEETVCRYCGEKLIEGLVYCPKCS